MPPPPHGFPPASPGALLMLAAALLMAAPAPAMAQNFFEALFGGGFRPQVAAYAPTPRSASRTWPRREQRLRAAEGRSKTGVSRAFEESGKPDKVEPPPVGAGPLGPFSQRSHPALRRCRGDVRGTHGLSGRSRLQPFPPRFRQPREGGLQKWPARGRRAGEPPGTVPPAGGRNRARSHNGSPSRHLRQTLNRFAACPARASTGPCQRPAVFFSMFKPP